MQTPITPERFWHSFAELLPKRLAEEVRPTIYGENTLWTNFMLYKFLPELGTTLGFLRSVRPGCSGLSWEWCRIDLGFFDIHDPIHGVDQNGDWEVTIEHENAGGWSFLDEFAKSTHMNCGLKVIITYHEYDSLSVPDKLDVAKQFYGKRRYRQANDRWLLIFGPMLQNIQHHDFVAHSFDGATFTQLPTTHTIQSIRRGESAMAEQRMVIEFLGGDMDGRTLDSQSTNPFEQTLVRCCLINTENGTIGKSYYGFSMTVLEKMLAGELDMTQIKPSGGQAHKYTVVERLDDDTTTIIRVKHSVRDGTGEP